MRSLALNGLCAVLALAVGGALCEAGLRLFYPRYHHAAEAHRAPADGQRIWKPPPNSHHLREHPDTGELHRVLRNNLGGRQHRNFDQQSLDDAVNLAFFGDSMTANVRMPVQYSFSEVLDFLLNAPAQPGRTARFNVLNFGVDAYGTGQQYILWRTLPMKSAFQHVFYVFCLNDIHDVHRRKLFVLDEDGALEEHLPAATPAWIRVLSRFHLTYLVMDGAERLRREWFERFPAPKPARQEGVAAADGPSDLQLWRAVVLRWQREVEEAGGRFTLVDLPHEDERAAKTQARALAALPASVETFSLWDCFRDELSVPSVAIPTHLLRFENDGHWHEGGNMVAAHCLYRLLDERFGLPFVSDEELAAQRYVYYRAFAEGDQEGRRWMPEPPWVAPSAFSVRAGRAIVERYLALEQSRTQLEEHWQAVVRSAKNEGPLARDVWEVYAAWDQRLLVYIKNPCHAETDLTPEFFLHVWATNLAQWGRGWRGSYPAHPSPSENRFLDIREFFVIWQRPDECAVGFHLPTVPFSHARTGQFVRPDGTLLWSVELPLRVFE